MLNFVEASQPKYEIHCVFQALGNMPLTLPQADHRKLQEHLADCRGATLLAYVLANKLMNTRSISEVNCTDLAIGGAYITYAIDGAAPETGLLVHNAHAEAMGGVIPVESLLGATLIGMRTGQNTPLLRANGSIGNLSITAVTHAT